MPVQATDPLLYPITLGKPSSDRLGLLLFVKLTRRPLSNRYNLFTK